MLLHASDKSEDISRSSFVRVRTGRQRFANAIQTFCFFGIVLLVAWAPLPFGSARAFAWGALTACIGAFIVLLGVKEAIYPEWRANEDRVLGPAGALFGIALFWASMQALPWVPRAWVHEIWGQASALLLDTHISPRITVDIASSVTGAFHFATYAALLWLVYYLSEGGEKARELVLFIAAIGTIYSVWGLYVYWTGNASVLWFQKWAYPNDLTSTFVNRNSYAAYAGLSLVAIVGLLLDKMRQIEGLDRRVVIARLAEGLTTRWIGYVAAIIIDATAVLLTHSRAGAAATAIGVVSLLAMAAAVPSLRGPWRRWCAAVLVISAIGLAAISGTVTLTRAVHTEWDLEGRHRIFELTIQAIANNPLLGNGLGTFRSIFPTYRTEDLPLVIDFAHDDYLESFLELGVPAALFLFCSLGYLVFRCFVGAFRRRRNAIYPCIAIGATTLVAADAVFDFSMQIPAVATSYFLLLGAGLAQAVPSRLRDSDQ